MTDDLGGTARQAVDGVEAEPDLFERARRRRAEKLADGGELLALPVSSWDGALVVRYGVLDPDEILLAYRDGKGTERNINLLAKACRGVYLRDPSSAFVQVTHRGHPVMFDQGLADKMHLPAGTDVYKLVLHLFGGNENAIAETAITYSHWVENTSREVDDHVVGEFVTGPPSSISAGPPDTDSSDSTPTI